MRHDYSELQSLLFKERLRQARLSFNLALFMAFAASAVVLIGFVQMQLGTVIGGAGVTTGGATTSVIYFKLSKDANDRLDHLATKSEKEA